MKCICVLLLFLLWQCNPNVECDFYNVQAFTHFKLNQNILDITNSSELLDIYDSPDGSVIKKLPPDEEGGWFVEVTGEQENLFRINLSGFGKEIHKSVWILKGEIGLNTRNYNNEKISLYENASKEFPSISYFDYEQTVRVLDVCGDWAFVEGKMKNGEIVKGWIPPEWQCGNAYTTCP